MTDNGNLPLQEQPTNQQPPAKLLSRSGRIRRGIGWALMIISTVTWLVGLLVIPFMPLSGTLKLSVIGALFGIAEITFWAALPFLGREVLKAFRRWMNPLNWWRWYKNRNAPPAEPAEPAEPDDAQ